MSTDRSSTVLALALLSSLAACGTTSGSTRNRNGAGELLEVSLDTVVELAAAPQNTPRLVQTISGREAEVRPSHAYVALVVDGQPTRWFGPRYSMIVAQDDATPRDPQMQLWDAQGHVTFRPSDVGGAQLFVADYVTRSKPADNTAIEVVNVLLQLCLCLGRIGLPPMGL